MIPGDDEIEDLDVFRAVDSLDPPGRDPLQFDLERVAQDAYEDRRHRGGVEPKKD